MKRFKYGLLAAAMIASTVAVSTADTQAVAPAGQWIRDGKGFWYKFAEGGWAKNEYINGYWIRKNGYWDEGLKYQWFATSSMQTIKWGASDGSWNAKNQWQKIDGNWYFFHSDEYMATNEYIRGKWVGADGRFNPGYSRGGWHQGLGDNAGKWWYLDFVGSSNKHWYPKNQWLKIDGYWYHFDAEGWMDSWKVAKLPVIPTTAGVSGEAVYAFGGSGRLGNVSSFNFADTITGSIEFDFTEGGAEAKAEAAEDMDLFLSLTMDEGTTKVLSVNGVDHVISVKNVNDVLTTYVDEVTLVDYVNASVSDKCVVTGSGKLANLMNAFDATGLGNGSNYNFNVKVGNMEFTKFRMSAGYVNFTMNGQNYQGLYDGEQSTEKPAILFLGNRINDLGQQFANANLLDQTGVNATCVNTANYAVVAASTLVPEN